MMLRKKRSRLSREEVQRYIDVLIAYRDQLKPDNPNRNRIDQQLANEEPVIAKTEIFKSRITGSPDDQHTLVAVTGIVAFGWTVGNTPSTVELFAPDAKPDKPLQINASWLSYLHGAKSSIQWQTDPATQTPLCQQKALKP